MGKLVNALQIFYVTYMRGISSSDSDTDCVPSNKKDRTSLTFLNTQPQSTDSNLLSKYALHITVKLGT